MSGSLPVQYSKIQIRRGLASELPGIPPQGTDVPSPGLDIGEFGYATDLGQLYIGVDPTSGLPQLTRGIFPYDNIEVLTEQSSNFLDRNFNFQLEDVRGAYIVSDPMQNSPDFNTFYDVTTSNAFTQNVPFSINVALNPGQAQIYYSLYQLSDGNPPVALKTGIIKVTYASGSLEPSMTDCGSCYQNFNYGGSDPNYAFGGITFSAIYLNGDVLFQYCNVTTYTPVICFRIERAVAPVS